MPCHPATMSWQACLDNDLPLSGARHWLPKREGQHSLGLKASWSQKGSSSPICSWIAASSECKIAGRWQSMHSDQGPSSQAENLCFQQISASWIEMSKNPVQFHRTTWSGVGTGWILPWVPFLPTPSPWPRCVPGLAKISIARAPRWAWMSLCSFFSEVSWWWAKAIRWKSCGASALWQNRNSCSRFESVFESNKKMWIESTANAVVHFLPLLCQGDLPIRDQETLAEELSLTGRMLIWIYIMHQVNSNYITQNNCKKIRILVIPQDSPVVQTCSYRIAVNYLWVQPILASPFNEGCQDQAFSQIQQRPRLELKGTMHHGPKRPNRTTWWIDMRFK